MSMSVCGSVCLCVCLSVREDIFRTTRAIFTKFFCTLPMSVARSSSGMFTIGRIACRREGVFFPTENALSAGKGGWECTARAKYATYDCLASIVQHHENNATEQRNAIERIYNRIINAVFHFHKMKLEKPHSRSHRSP